MTMKRILRSAAAEAIRAHLWQPHPPGPHGGRPWTMGRELDIFDRLVSHGWDPVELLGAIAHIRTVAGTTGPARPLTPAPRRILMRPASERRRSSSSCCSSSWACAAPS